jgi:ankyrin repeat protein
LALFGGDFAIHYLSQSTSWLDCIILAAGPLGVPTIIVAAIRVGGDDLLKLLIGQARESGPSVEKALKSSTSNEVCERYDGKKVIRVETRDPLITEVIYAKEKWYDLKGAEDDEILTPSTTPSTTTSTTPSTTPGLQKGDLEKGIDHTAAPSNLSPAPPPNLSLNIPETSCWELPAAAIFGISLQLLVLTIAGMTTFHPQWKAKYPVKLYEFCCMAVGTVLLTFGVITCALMVEQSTTENTYTSTSKQAVGVLWLQRGTSSKDQSDGHFILKVNRRKIRTSYQTIGYLSTRRKMLTLAGILATAFGYITQFIGLGSMHWPTQTAQFAITIIMTGVRALVRRGTGSRDLYTKIRENHELDWLVTQYPTPADEGGSGAHAWQILTGGDLGKFEDTALLTRNDIEKLSDRKIPARPKGKVTSLATEDKWQAQRMLRQRQDLGALVKWYGPARKWAISLATAIDAVMHVLQLEPRAPFLWPLNVRTAGGNTQRIFLEVRHNSKWESNISEIEAALSLGLFGAEHNTTVGNGSTKSGDEDWCRSEFENDKRKKCIMLLGPSTGAALRNLKWWLGPQNSKLKELTLVKDGGKFSSITQRRPQAFQDSAPEENLSPTDDYPIVGFATSWHDEGNYDPPASFKCLATVSEVDLELLYARHMFSAFMWSITHILVEDGTKEPLELPNFDPKDGKSWRTLQLRNATVLELVNCVERAGLGDMEDAYLSIIPPLSIKLLGYNEVFKFAQDAALVELSKENWSAAYNVYSQLFRNSIIFSVRDEMAVKSTALLTEFLRLLHRGWGPPELIHRVRQDLKGADGDVLHHLAKMYERQGWPEAGEGFPTKLPENILKIEDIHRILGQNSFHRGMMEIDFDDRKELGQILMGLGPHPQRPTTDFFGRTPLHYAAWNGTFRTKNSELKASDEFTGFLGMRNLRTADCYGMTALHAATEAGNDELFELLVSWRCAREGTFQNWTALHIAADRGNESAVKELLRCGVQTTTKGPGGRNALHLAVLRGHDAVASMLIERAGYNAVDDDGLTALHFAAMIPRFKPRGFIADGLDIEEGWRQHVYGPYGEDEVEKKEREDELEREEKEDQKSAGVVTRLIERLGNQKNAIDHRAGMTALHMAVRSTNYRMVRILVEGGVDVTIRDIDGDLAREKAKAKDMYKAEELLDKKELEATLK